MAEQPAPPKKRKLAIVLIGSMLLIGLGNWAEKRSAHNQTIDNTTIGNRMVAEEKDAAFNTWLAEIGNETAEERQSRSAPSASPVVESESEFIANCLEAMERGSDPAVMAVPREDRRTACAAMRGQ